MNLNNRYNVFTSFRIVCMCVYGCAHMAAWDLGKHNLETASLVLHVL